MTVVAGGACRQRAVALDDEPALAALGECLVSFDVEVELEHESLIVDHPTSATAGSGGRAKKSTRHGVVDGSLGDVGGLVTGRSGATQTMPALNPAEPIPKAALNRSTMPVPNGRRCSSTRAQRGSRWCRARPW